MMAIRYTLLLLLSASSIGAIWGQGALVPTHPLPPEERRPTMIRPFSITYQRADTRINDGVAETTIEQSFRNDSPVEQEAVYLFPVPVGATITRLTMTIGDRIVEGKLLGREEARAIYESIVRRRRDPALLEFAERGLVRLSVFPIPPGGERKLTIRYAETLKQEGGALRYVYPMKATGSSNRPIERLGFQAEIKTTNPIQSVYSPTHSDASIRVRGASSASVSWESSHAYPDRDLVLYIRAGSAAFGLSLQTYRVGEDGYFLVNISPSMSAKAADIPKHVVFVVDRTGSMSGEKMQQAKAAFKYTIEHLKSQDRFGLIVFNEQPDMFEPAMVAATPENVRRAIRYVAEIEANGGTNIATALESALKMFRADASGGMRAILFMTDGLPTVGETDVNRILSHVKDLNESRVRLFNWGVGYDVNVHFLDRLGEQNRGESDYVKPSENMEVKISAYYDRLSSPVLTDLKLFFRGVNATEVYPRELPDLFRGGQLTVTGRYRGSGTGAVVLEGLARRDPHSVKLAINWPERADMNDYIPRLWAARKIGYLMDEVRLHHNQELVNEITRLAREYGIVTEYTSYLIDENQIRLLSEGRGREYDEVGARVFHLQTGGGPSGDTATNLSRASRDLQNSASAQLAPAAKASGKASDMGIGRIGRVSGEMNSLTDSARVLYSRAATQMQNAGDRAFYFDGNRWIDSRNDAGLRVVNVQRNSDAHFALIRRVPGFASQTAIGDEVLVVVGRNAVVVGDTGKTSLSGAELDAIAPAPRVKASAGVPSPLASGAALSAALGGAMLVYRRSSH